MCIDRKGFCYINMHEEYKLTYKLCIYMNELKKNEVIRMKKLGKIDMSGPTMKMN
jgi:hypothetical protein